MALALIIMGWVGAVYPSLSQGADACGAAQVERIRRLAQALEPATATEGIRFLESCPRLRDETLLWLTYFFHARGEYDRASALTRPAPGHMPTGNERDQLLNQASQGEPQALEKYVRRGLSGYAGDAEALLVLARALARNKRFGDARIYYTQYLKLKPDDREIEIEEAYTWVWEGQGRKAEARFRELSQATDLTEAQATEIESGLKTASQMDTTVRRPRSIDPAFVAAQTEITSTNFHDFSRSTTGALYRGEFWSAQAQAHWLASTLPQTKAYGAVEGLAGASGALSPRLFASAKAGGFSTGRSTFLYDVSGEYRLAGGGSPYGGIYRSALAKDVPLPEALSATVRTGVYAGFRYRSLLDARLELRSFAGLTSSRHLSTRIAFPIREYEGPGLDHGGLSLLLLAENENFTQASTYLYSPRTTTALRAAAEYVADFKEEVSGKLTLAYGTVFETAQSGSALSFGSSATLLGAGAELEYQFSKDWLATIRLNFDRTGGADGNATYAATLLGLGLTFRLGPEGARR